MRSPASWEAQYEEMRSDEQMALQAAVEDEEYEQVARAQEEWEAQCDKPARQWWLERSPEPQRRPLFAPGLVNIGLLHC